MQYIRPFNGLGKQDIALVGGKNASLGEMTQHITSLGIRVPEGFALTVDAYWYFLKSNNLMGSIERELAALQADTYASLPKRAAVIRALIENGKMPDDLRAVIVSAYEELSRHAGAHNIPVAVRSSATAEDLPTASFAGQQETFLYVVGADAVCNAVVKCMASLFTDRAMLYRREHNFDHMKVGLSVGIQCMVRSDSGCAGVAFSLDTETGHPGFVLINGAWGLGELVVQGAVVPDEYLVHKDRLLHGFSAIVKRMCGSKTHKLVYNLKSARLEKVVVSEADQRCYVLDDAQIDELAHAVIALEKHYDRPMDIEWAVDGVDKKLYILQARPETIHSTAHAKQTMVTYSRQDNTPLTILAEGISIGTSVATGVVRVLETAHQAHEVTEGDVIVTRMTDPDWMPALKKAVAVVTQEGGRTCHAAIVSRELGITALVGATDCMQKLKTGQMVTIDCTQGARGFVYDGAVKFEKKEIEIDSLPTPPVPLQVIMSDPDTALRVALLPAVSGVGLARLEFIITHAVGIHPMALVHPERVTDTAVRAHIDQVTAVYKTPADFFVDTVGRALALIAASFYPRPVLVRLSDFKTNEYRSLLGGEFFETEEENPMLGFRGAGRYIDPRYADAFALECKALLWARNNSGFDNIRVMIPFVRTVSEAQTVTQALAVHGLERGKNGLQLYMMCEIPSNVMLMSEFAPYFDGFSIGSNDLTQLTLGVDRDAGELGKLYNETDPAVYAMMRMAIAGAHAAGKPIGICGQAPSDYLEVAQFLIEQKIDSLSLNPDSVIPYLLRLKNTL